MEVEHTETPKTPEVAEVVETETLSEIDQAQINEWMDEKIGPLETEDVETESDTPTKHWSEIIAEPETAVEAEPAAAAEPEPEPETPKVSKAFSKVAKKEREVQREKQELNKLKAELEPLRKAKERADKGDYLGALDGIGWNYESATNQVLQDGKLQEPKADPAALTPEVESRLAKLETMERQKQVDNYVNRMKTKVEADERFELVKDNWDNAWPTILEMQKIVANETGTIKQDEEILLEVENFYEQQAQSLAKSSKMKKLFQPEAGSPEKPSDSPRTRKTLRNKVTASQPADKGTPKSRRERLEAALATYGSNL